MNEFLLKRAYFEGIQLAFADSMASSKQANLQDPSTPGANPATLSPVMPTISSSEANKELLSTMAKARAGQKKLQHMALQGLAKAAAGVPEFDELPDAQSHKRLTGAMGAGLAGGLGGSLLGALLSQGLPDPSMRQRAGMVALGGGLGTLSGGYAGYKHPELGGAVLGAGMGAGLGGILGHSLGDVTNSPNLSRALALLGGVGGLGLGGYAGYKALQPQADR